MCGTVLDENAEFCSECGAKQNTNSKKLETVEKTEEKSETKVCPVCGEVMISNVRFCPRCGKSMNGQPNATNIIYTAQIVPANPVHYSGMAIAGFVLSFFFPVLGIIFSAIGMGQTKNAAMKGRGLAIAGLVISIVFCCLGFVLILLGGLSMAMVAVF